MINFLKDMRKAVSVIVPVYNVSAYLRCCVESLLVQAYKDLEIILVDDGSTDESGDLCEQLGKLDSRIVVCHKPNGGVSSARNCGIRKATGAYVMFVDGDDWLDVNGVALLVNGLETSKADICFCNKYYKNMQEVKIATSLPGDKVYSAGEIARMHLHYGFIASPCLSLLRIDKARNVAFREDIHTLEDWEYNFRVLTSVRSVFIVDVPYYHYRSVEGSASKSPLNDRKLTCFKIVDAVRSVVREKNLPFANDAINVPAFLIYHMLVAYAKNGDVDKSGERLRALSRKYLSSIMWSSHVDLKHKIYTLMASINLELFGVLYNAKNR